MDLKSAINIILRDLQEARDLIDDLRNKPDLPDLQIELAKSKCKSAEELIRLIGELISLPGAAEKIEFEKEEKAESAVKDEQPDNFVDNDILNLDEEPESGVTNEMEESEVPAPDIVHEHLPPSQDNDDTIEHSKEKKSEKIVADRFTHLANRINEKVGDSKKAEGKTRSLPVTDLNRAIGINDRFYYIRELFNGQEDAFRHTIDKLNSAGSKEEATTILSEAVKDLADSEPAHQLIELVERKLSVK